MPLCSIDTPLGPVTVEQNGAAITALHWRGGASDDTPLLRQAMGQIRAYFARREPFVLPFEIHGSKAQQAACAAMAAIPLGDTRTYGELARDLGISAQAVGQLCGGNPLPLIVPCHRVLGAGGLGGFSAPGGIEAKVWLLRHEGAGLLI